MLKRTDLLDILDILYIQNIAEARITVLSFSLDHNPKGRIEDTLDEVTDWVLHNDEAQLFIITIR